MKSVYLSLLACALALCPLPAAQNRYIALAGDYQGPCKMAAPQAMQGTLVISIRALKKRRDVATISISGLLERTDVVPGTGNSVPVNGRVRIVRGRVTADNFLLGLRAESLPSRASRAAGRNGKLGFSLVSAEGLGRLRCDFTVRDGVLILFALGESGPDGRAERVNFSLSAKRR